MTTLNLGISLPDIITNVNSIAPALWPVVAFGGGLAVAFYLAKGIKRLVAKR